MKKNLFWILMFMFLAFCSFSNATSIGDVQLKFCNETEVSTGVYKPVLTKSLSLEMDRGQKENLCMQFTNLWSETITLKENFVDWTITNDSSKNKACKDENNIENFGKYVSGDVSAFTLKPGQSIRKYAELQFDWNVGWQIYGCVTFYEAEELDKIQDGMFKVLVRRANFVDVLLSGDIVSNLDRLDVSDSHKNYSKNKKIFITKSDELKWYELLLWFQNNGSISQSLIVTWTIKSMFGMKKNIFQQDRNISAWETVSLKELVESLPRYGWFVTLEFDVEHHALLAFDGDEITDNMKKTYHMQESAKFFLFTRWLLLFVALFLVMVYVLFFLLIRHKKHKENVRRSPHAHRKESWKLKVENGKLSGRWKVRWKKRINKNISKAKKSVHKK